MKKQKFILDTDPGIDDALAIALACRHADLELLGVCAVAGNALLSCTYPNAKNIMKLCGRADVPVLRGHDAPLEKKLRCGDDAHGINGLDGYEFLDQPKLPETEEAVNFMIDMVMRYPHEVTIVAIGPFTNVAAAIQQEEQFASHVKRILVMGGAVNVPGNVSAVAEFNVMSDPLAAQIIVNSGIDVSFIPLDITLQTRLKPEDLAEICENNHPVSNFLNAVLKHRFEVLEARGELGYPMHDPLTIGALIDPSLIQYEDYFMQIETTQGALAEGMCVLDRRREAPKPNVHVGVGVDSDRFLTLYKETIRGY